MKKDLQYLKNLFSEPFQTKRAGGQTNRNFIITCKGKKFFVRLPWEQGDIMNRTIEGKNILALSRSKKLKEVLPAYYLYILKKKNILNPKEKKTFDAPDGTMITEYIAGREFTIKDFWQKKYQKSLVQMFCHFHKSKVSFVNFYNVFRDEIRKYRKKAQGMALERFLDEKSISQLLLLERQAEENLKDFKRSVATHNDFIFQNFLIGKNKKMYLLDFEYAGQSKKGGMLYDFGFLFADNLFRSPKMTKSSFEEFLNVADKVYKKKLDRKQIYWSAIAATLVQIWWGILRYFAVPVKERAYFKDYVMQRIQGIAKLQSELK